MFLMTFIKNLYTHLRCVLALVLFSCAPIHMAYGDTNTIEINIASVDSPKHLSLFDNIVATAPEIFYQNVYEGLVRYNGSDKIVTGLSHAWTHNDDYTEWTFELRRDVKFHDGAMFNADDVIFTFRNIQVRNSGVWQKLFMDINFVKKDSPWRIVFLLKRPVKDFLKYLARPEAVIVNASTWFDNPKKPNGTGPFIYLKFQRGERLELLKNHDYWDQLGRVDKIVYHFNQSMNSVIKKMNTGEYDSIIGLKNTTGLDKLNPELFRIVSHKGGGILTLVANQKRGALAQHPVRVAIAHALNRDDMISQTMMGHASPAHNTVRAYHEIDGKKPYYEYNLAKAQDIINRAGYNQGMSVNISLQDTPAMHAFASVIKKQIEQAGIHVILTPISVEKWYQHIYVDKKFEIALTVEEGEFNILNLMSPNFFNYNSSEVDMLIDTIIATDNDEIKTTNMMRLQSIMAEDASVIPLIKMNYTKAIRKTMKIPAPSSYRPQLLLNETYVQN